MVKFESIYVLSILPISTMLTKVKGWNMGLQKTKEYQGQKKLEAFRDKFSKWEKLFSKPSFHWLIYTFYPYINRFHRWTFIFL